MTRFCRLVLISCCVAAVALAQEPPPTPQEPPAPAGAAPGPAPAAPPRPPPTLGPPPPRRAPAAGAAAVARPGMTPPSQDPQPYDKVITKDAKTKKGLFLVHQIKDKFYYEIPKAELNKEFLWNSLEIGDRKSVV